HSLLFLRSVDHRHLHSFPTRRSSDLVGVGVVLRAERALVVGVEAAVWRAVAPVDIDVPRSVVRARVGEGAEVEHGRGTLVRGLRSEEHTSELQSRENLVCRLLLEKKK